MCGRLFMNMSPNQVRQISRCTLVRNSHRHRPSFNVCPTSYIPCIRRRKASDDEQSESIEVTNADTGATKTIPNNGSSSTTTAAANPIPELIIAKSTYTSEFEESKETHGDQLLSDEQIAAAEAQQQVRVLDYLQWGFNGEFSHIINIRSEEADMKRTFVGMLQRNRCVIITQGYFEWTPEKVPSVFKCSDSADAAILGDHMLICGLFSEVTGEVMLLTRESFGKFDKVHHRMPVFISQDEIADWLNPNVDYKQFLFGVLLKRDKPIYDTITSYKCSPAVNNVRETSVKCLMSAEEYTDDLTRNGISKYFKKPTNVKANAGSDNANHQQVSYYEINKAMCMQSETDQLAKKIESVEIGNDIQRNKKELDVVDHEEKKEIDAKEGKLMGTSYNNMTMKGTVSKLKRRWELGYDHDDDDDDDDDCDGEEEHESEDLGCEDRAEMLLRKEEKNRLKNSSNRNTSDGFKKGLQEFFDQKKKKQQEMVQLEKEESNLSKGNTKKRNTHSTRKQK